jgi:transposase-like protein
LNSSSSSLPPIAPGTTSTEVTEKATRRRFTAAYKQQILREADACTKPGEVGALLRREGLYSSTLVKWRRQRRQGEQAGLSAKRRGPLPSKVDARDVEIASLRRQLRKSEARAQRAEGLVALQKKVSEILGIALPDVKDEDDS